MKGLPTEMANAPMRAMRFARGLLIMATWHDHRILLLAPWFKYTFVMEWGNFGKRRWVLEREVSHYIYFVVALKCVVYSLHCSFLLGTCRNNKS